MFFQLVIVQSSKGVPLQLRVVPAGKPATCPLYECYAASRSQFEETEVSGEYYAEHEGWGVFRKDGQTRIQSLRDNKTYKPKLSVRVDTLVEGEEAAFLRYSKAVKVADKGSFVLRAKA